MAKFGDVSDLVEKIQRALQNPSEIARLSVNARNLALSMFSREKTKLELYLAYHRACSIDPE
jgi:glycosyltransferase involved in cell wall biosynthesis